MKKRKQQKKNNNKEKRKEKNAPGPSPGLIVSDALQRTRQRSTSSFCFAGCPVRTLTSVPGVPPFGLTRDKSSESQSTPVLMVRFKDSSLRVKAVTSPEMTKQGRVLWTLTELAGRGSFKYSKPVWFRLRRRLLVLNTVPLTAKPVKRLAVSEENFYA